jgi:hypothetical protein
MMWVREQSCSRSWDTRLDRWSWSPLCSTLLAALVLESEVARADEPRPISALDSAPEVALTALDQDGPAPITAPIGLVRVAAPLPALPAFTATAVPAPGSALPSDVSAFVRADDQAQPVRLDAAAVLSLNDLFLAPELWRAAFPGYEAPIRWLEFGGEGLSALEPPPIEKKRKRNQAFSGVPGLKDEWLEEHIELSVNDGIAYKTNFTWRGTNLRLKIWGPVLKGDAGLGVRLRGFQLSGHPVELRARATADIQDIQIKIAF